MLQDEHGLSLDGPDPLKAGSATLIAFVIVGFIPLSPFVLNWLMPGTTSVPFAASIVLTGVAFFVVGALKARFILQRWFVGGLETLAIGGCAASLSYAIGWALRGVLE